MSALRSHNNKTRGGLGRVCATGMYRSIEHVKFPKFQTGIFVEWKAPKYYACSLGVNFLQNSCWYRAKRAPAYVDYRRHGLVHDVPVEDIKVVFDRLFRHSWREREKTKKNEKAFE